MRFRAMPIRLQIKIKKNVMMINCMFYELYSSYRKKSVCSLADNIRSKSSRESISKEICRML